MDQNTIKFSGNNDKLFSRVVLESVLKKTLIVPETHNAILIKDGQMLQTLSSGKYSLQDFVDVKEEGDCALEVLFMSKTAKLKLLWGTAQKILMFDETLQENFHIGLSGDFEVQIGDPRKAFLYLVGASEDLTVDALQERLQSNVVSVLESVLVDFVKENKIPFNQIATNKKQISQKVLAALSHKLQSEYGIAVFSFNIANIIFDSEEMKKLEEMFRKNKPKTFVCSNCGVSLEEGAKFCPNCGQKTFSGKVCPKCHAQNNENARFCSSCGSVMD